MNKPNIQILRNFIATLNPSKFDMRFLRTERECGTVCCLDGWAIHLAAHDFKAKPQPQAVWGEGWLGLTVAQSNVLFTPPGFMNDGAYLPIDALFALDSLLKADDDTKLPVWPKSCPRNALCS